MRVNDQVVIQLNLFGYSLVDFLAEDFLEIIPMLLSDCEGLVKKRVADELFIVLIRVVA